MEGRVERSPAGHVRRPSAPAKSPAPGFTQLHFEALRTAARQSSNRCDLALVAMPGLPGPRIFEATAAGIADLGEEHGHRVLRVCGKGSTAGLIPRPPAAGPAIGRATPTHTPGPALPSLRGRRVARPRRTRVS